MSGAFSVFVHTVASTRLLSGVLAIAIVVSLVVFALGVAAFRRRRSSSYLLVVIALFALLGRGALGALTMSGAVPVDLHHLVEHGLDAATAGCLLAAVYLARTPASTNVPGGER